MAKLFTPPSRTLAILMIPAAAAIAIFGVVTLILEGYPWFALLWAALAGGIIIAAVRRVRATSR